MNNEGFKFTQNHKTFLLNTTMYGRNFKYPIDLVMITSFQ